MKRTYLILGAMVLLSFGATGAVADDLASASAEGACYDDGGNGASDNAVVTITTDGVDASEPDAEALGQALQACAENGGLPGGGSYLAGDVSIVNGAVAVSGDSVPVSEAASGDADLSSSGEGEAWCGDEADAGSVQLLGEDAAQLDWQPDADTVVAGVVCVSEVPDSGGVSGEGSLAGGALEGSVSTSPVFVFALNAA